MSNTSMFDPKALATIDKMLLGVWEHSNDFMLNKEDGHPYCEKDGLDVDSDGNKSEYTTVSEGVGYRLFRDLLMGIWARRNNRTDVESTARGSFERVVKWADKNLRRDRIDSVYDIEKKKWVPVRDEKRDSLPAWRWVPSLAGRDGGIVHARAKRKDDEWVDGLDTAPDANFFMIASLRMASILWPDDKSSGRWFSWAKEMTVDSRKKFGKKISGYWHLLGGDEFHMVNGINPSYAFEAIHPIFAELDPEGASFWLETQCTAFAAAVAGADAVFLDHDKRRVRGQANVPPNWFSFDGTNITDMPWFNDDDWYMGWDGVRTLWTKAAWYLANGNADAHRYLTDFTGSRVDWGPHAFLTDQFERFSFMKTCYGIDGISSGTLMKKKACDLESPFANGIYLGFFYAAADKKMANAILQRLMSAYQDSPTDAAGRGTFKIHGRVESDNYYSDNWAWMGLAMAAGLVEDMFSTYATWREGHRVAPFPETSCDVERYFTASQR